jgi:hypothetical protein
MNALLIQAAMAATQMTIMRIEIIIGEAAGIN